MGSSPQVRGRSHRGAVSWGLGGLIPAGAGQIPRRGPNQFAVPAHPRRCGADLMTYRKTGVRMGSSPQVRGRWRSKDRAHTSCGLIPAGAGQILVCSSGGTGPRAHPRRCGADALTTKTRRLLDGSSPQVRGRLIVNGWELAVRRLIPAGAGQMHSFPFFVKPRQAHPRRCGADLSLGVPSTLQ